jgi:hypothetical protein
MGGTVMVMSGILALEVTGVAKSQAVHDGMR